MRTRILFLSAVSGGPIDRLIDQLNASARVEARVRSLFTTIGWRHWRSKGGLIAHAVRALVMLAYPWYGLLAVRDADLIITTTNPFWMPNLALITRRIHRRPVITLVYDVYPDSVGQLARLPRTALGLMHALNRSWMLRSDAVVFISEGMRTELTCRYGNPQRQRVIVTGVDASEFDDPEPQVDLEEWSSSRILISYVGNAGRVHDVQTVTDVLRRVVRQNSRELSIFISASGERSEAFRQAMQNEPQVKFEGALEDDRWAWILARTDVAVVSLNDASAFSSMPSKYFSALGAGCAVFVVAPRTSDLYRLTLSHNVGVAVEPGSVAEGVRQLSSLLASPAALGGAQASARLASAQHFDLAVVRATWLRLIEEIAG